MPRLRRVLVTKMNSKITGDKANATEVYLNNWGASEDESGSVNGTTKAEEIKVKKSEEKNNSNIKVKTSDERIYTPPSPIYPAAGSRFKK